MNESRSIAVHQEPAAQVSLQTMERAASAMSASGFYGVKTKDEALALMLVGQSEGIHFAAAVRDFHIISGRPAMKADAMLARFQRAGGTVEWKKLTDKEVTADFFHPQGGKVTITWDDARVDQAGLKNPMHGKYPRQMKRARVISEGIRTIYPGAITGSYSVEEAQDMAFEEQPRTQVAESPQLEAPIGKAEGDSGAGLTDAEIQEHTEALTNAPDEAGLRSAFAAAWKHGKESKDATAQSFFQKVYGEQKLARGIAE